MSINKVILTGYLTRDAELRQTAGGTSVLSFGMAVNDRRRNNQTGEWEDYANFIDCAVFGSRAESISKYMKKGVKVALDGRLHYSSWDKDGQKRSKLQVTVNDIDFMQRANSDNGSSAEVAAATVGGADQREGAQRFQDTNAAESADGYYHAVDPAYEEVTPSLYDEDIPF